MAVRGVDFVIAWIRNATQGSSHYHNGAETGHTVAAAIGCWLSQRGSYWLLTLSARQLLAVGPAD